MANGIWTLDTTKSQAGFLALETGATVTVTEQATGNAVTVYEDAAGATEKGSGGVFTLTSSESRIEFFADDSKLYKIVITKGSTTLTLTYQSVHFDTDTVASPDFFTISGNITLDSTHRGKTGYITANAVITLPVYADQDAAYTVELIKDQASRTVTFATQSTDTVRDSETVLDTDAVIIRTPTSGRWAAIGGASAP